MRDRNGIDQDWRGDGESREVKVQLWYSVWEKTLIFSKGKAANKRKGKADKRERTLCSRHVAAIHLLISVGLISNFPMGGGKKKKAPSKGQAGEKSSHLIQTLMMFLLCLCIALVANCHIIVMCEQKICIPKSLIWSSGALESALTFLTSLKIFSSERFTQLCVVT